MIMELLGHEDYIRILLAMRKEGAMRFTQIQKDLRLNPNQVDRALKFLSNGLWILARTIPAQKGPIFVEYTLGKRGEAFLESFDSFRAAARVKSAALGPSEIKELQAL